MLLLFELECLFDLFAEDKFIATLDTSGKLSIYWSNQEWEKPVGERYFCAWKEVFLFVIPDSVFAVDDILKFRFKSSTAVRLYDNPLVSRLNILEQHYPSRVVRRGTWGEAIILPYQNV
jgi:hypothetical protein